MTDQHTAWDKLPLSPATDGTPDAGDRVWDQADWQVGDQIGDPSRDRPALSVTTIGLVTALIIGTAFGGGAAISGALAVLCLWSLLGPRQVIQSLVIATIITSAYPDLGFAEGPYTLMRWLLLAVCLGAVSATLVLTRRQLHLCAYHVVAILFLIVMSFLTALTSYNVSIALMKLLSFSLITGMIAIAFAILTEDEMESLQGWFDNFWYGFILATAFFAVTPYGYLLNGDLQGSIYNPQPFSVISVFGFVWFSYRYVTCPGRRSLILASLAVLMLFILMSASRTALFAVLVSVLLPAAIFLTLRTRALDAGLRLLLSPGALAIYVTSMAVLMFSTIDVGQIIDDIIRKYENTTNVAEAFQAARGRVIYESWLNFLEHPLFGIGFGIPSSLDVTNVTVDPILGLPISSSVEKGNIYSAVLEETGIIGTIFFVAMVIALFRGPAVVAASVPILVAGFAVNLGEAIFFSMGGVGLLLWVMFGFAGSFRRAPDRHDDILAEGFYGEARP